MIDLNNVNAISYSLYQQLLAWRVKEHSFQITNNDAPTFVRKTMTAQKDGFSFRVILYVTEENDEFDKIFLVESNHNCAHATILDKNIQQKLLEQARHFSQYCNIFLMPLNDKPLKPISKFQFPLHKLHNKIHNPCC